MLDADRHAGEDAELYALGSLDAVEGARIERHVATCEACRNDLANAEAAVLHMIEDQAARESLAVQLPPLRVRDRASSRTIAAFAGALAAAVALAVLAWQNAALDHERRQDQVAMTAMLAGHFLHAPLVAAQTGAPAGKVIFARDGAWAYVLVEPGSQAYDVAAVTDGLPAVVAHVPASRTVRSAFVRFPRAPDSVALMRDGRIVASTRIVRVKER